VGNGKLFHAKETSIKISHMKFSERNKGSIQNVKNRWRFREDLGKILVIRHAVML